jgi:hypothetical protein
MGAGSLLAYGMLQRPQDRDHSAEQATARTFSATLAVACFGASLWPVLSGGNVRGWVLVAAGGLAIAALVPPLGIQLARAWIRLGTLIGYVAAPIAMGMVFLLVVTPTGLALRLLRKDSLRLRPDAGATTYWIERTASSPSPGDFRRQF